MGIMEKIRALFARDSVLVISVFAALLSCIAVPPDAEYVVYIDWHTLVLLFCLMTVVAGLRFLGVIRILGEWVVKRMHSKVMIATALLALTFCCSMFITNDVALITFVPFAIVVMHRASMDAYMGPVVALMTIAANLGSMLLPMGNPQNLYLFQASGMDVASFVWLMMPYTVFAAVLLLIFLLVVFRKKDSENTPQNQQQVSEQRVSGQQARAAAENTGKRCLLISHRKLPFRKCFCAVVYAVLFVVCLCAVANLIDVYTVGLVVLVVVLLVDRKILARIDYGLLFTFIALFIFVGNMGRIPVIHDVVSQLIGAVPVLASVLVSQVISNVPAALLLSEFTDQWHALIVGTNLGGLGTLIASMASIISFKLITTEGLVKRGVYLRTFTMYNVVFLLLLLILYAVLAYTGIAA